MGRLGHPVKDGIRMFKHKSEWDFDGVRDEGIRAGLYRSKVGAVYDYLVFAMKNEDMFSKEDLSLLNDGFREAERSIWGRLHPCNFKFPILSHEGAITFNELRQQVKKHVVSPEFARLMDELLSESQLRETFSCMFKDLDN